MKAFKDKVLDSGRDKMKKISGSAGNYENSADKAGRIAYQGKGSPTEKAANSPKNIQGNVYKRGGKA